MTSPLSSLCGKVFIVPGQQLPGVFHIIYEEKSAFGGRDSFGSLFALPHRASN